MSTEIGAFEAKTKLSELLAATEAGETFTITRRGKPVARLVPVGPDLDRRAAALDRLDGIRQRVLEHGGGLTIEEILSARDEGRK